jgi:hypothetical protein
MQLPGLSLFAFAFLIQAVIPASAQLPSSGSPGVNAALPKLFGETKAFTAKCNLRAFDKDQNETVTANVDFALLDSKMRIDVDMTQLKSKDIPPDASAALKQMGMDKFISISRPDKLVTYVVIPGVQSFINKPMSKEEADAALKEPKVEKTAVGKETIDGHPCVKTKLEFTGAQGNKEEAFTWNATDMKDFPVQIQTKDKDSTVILRFKQIQLSKPDGKRFEPPSGFSEYASEAQMMQGIATKLLGAGAAEAKE